MFHYIANRKGGVGKTTLSVYLATAVAMALEEPVLLVDTDPQNNAGMVMGFEDVQLRRASIENYLRYGGRLMDYIVERDEFIGCHLIGSGQYDLWLVEQGERGAVEFADFLLELSNLPYKHVFFDSPPAFGVVQQLCLRACESVVIPVQPGYLPLEGLRLLINSIYRCLEGRSTPLEGLRVVVNHRQPPNALAGVLEQELREGLGSLVMDTVVPYSQWFERCAVEGINLLDRVKGNPPVVAALHSLAREFLALVSQPRKAVQTVKTAELY
jgi:chromosome partitioning protein